MLLATSRWTSKGQWGPLLSSLPFLASCLIKDTSDGNLQTLRFLGLGLWPDPQGRAVLPKRSPLPEYPLVGPG